MPKSNLPKASSFVSICSWNVGGLFSKTINKITASDFLKELLPYDIVFLSETHTGYENRILFEDFQHFPVCRPISTNNRYYGGLALLIRNTIRNGIKILKNTSSEYQWVKLCKNFFIWKKISTSVFHTFHPVTFKPSRIQTQLRPFLEALIYLTTLSM